MIPNFSPIRTEYLLIRVAKPLPHLAALLMSACPPPLTCSLPIRSDTMFTACSGGRPELYIMAQTNYKLKTLSGTGPLPLGTSMLRVCVKPRRPSTELNRPHPDDFHPP